MSTAERGRIRSKSIRRQDYSGAEPPQHATNSLMTLHQTSTHSPHYSFCTFPPRYTDSFPQEKATLTSHTEVARVKPIRSGRPRPRSLSPQEAPTLSTMQHLRP